MSDRNFDLGLRSFMILEPDSAEQIEGGRNVCKATLCTLGVVGKAQTTLVRSMYVYAVNIYWILRHFKYQLKQ